MTKVKAGVKVKKAKKAELHITRDHRGKMKDMQSISTSCKCNKRCEKNAKIKGSICESCFAQRQLDYMTSMQVPLERNFKLLTKGILPLEDLPYLNVFMFRIESFGDLANVTQAINYLNLIRKNPWCHFAWWTKNPDFIAKAFKKTGYEKPKNLIIIRSSLMVNKPVKPGYWFVDKVFTVYDKEYAETHGIEINCGARHCFTCHTCYFDNGVIYINELKK